MSNRRFLPLVLASLLACIVAIVLSVGIAATPYETPDSAGRTMGFNDPLSAEHYTIIVRNFRILDLLRWQHAYDWLLLAAHVMGCALLLAGTRVSTRAVRWYFAVQPLVFPIGLVFGWVTPLILLSLAHSPMDREGFIDVPFVAFYGQTCWVVVSLILVFALRGPGLGLANAWRAFRAGVTAGGRVFVGALR